MIGVVAGVGLVTVLFTDLVDSTALAASLGPDAADEFRRAHFDSLRDAIAAHGGTEVKNLGDGLMVTFDRPSDGATCAVEMQRQTARLAKRMRNERIAIRVGIAVGEATTENGDWFGPPVVEAARLCAFAATSQILATEVVRTLSAGRDVVTFQTLGETELKGLPAPVAVVEVEWSAEPDLESLPPALEATSSAFFVGRELEAERLLSLWKQSLEGSCRVALVAGEPGIGKTCLARELANRALLQGGTVLYGRCDEDLGMPYQPLVEALDHYVATCDLRLLDGHVGAWGGEIGRIIPALTKRRPDADPPVAAEPSVEQYRLFEAVLDVLARASEPGGVVVIFDDLHWADKATLLLVRHLLRAGHSSPILVVGTYRDTDLDRGHPLADMLADFRRSDDVERIVLPGLDRAGVESFVEAAAGQQLDADGIALADAVHAETEGNPFFVGQVLRHLAETGAIDERDGVWAFDGDVSQLGIPEGVREVIGRRLSRLDDETNVVLHIAAVVGRQFDLRLVAEVGDVAEDVVVDALEEAAAARLVDEVPGVVDQYSFTHALVRESLYDELSTSRRVRVHRRIGRALEQRPGTPLAALAHHFCEAAAGGDPELAAGYALRAGDEAAESLAHADATAQYRRGLDVLDEADGTDGGLRLDLLLGLSGSSNRAGDIDVAHAVAVSAAALADRLDDPERFAIAAMLLPTGVPPIVSAADEPTVAAALDRLPPGDSAVKARLMGIFATAPQYRVDRAARTELTADALAMARRIGDSAALVEALVQHHDAIWGPESVEERLTLADEMLQHERGAYLGARAAQRITACFELGDLDATREAVAQYHEVGGVVRMPGVQAWLGIWDTALHLFHGHVADGEASLMAWSSDPRGLTEDVASLTFGVQVFDLRRTQGRVEEIEPALRAIAHERMQTLSWRAAITTLAADLDRREEASELFASMADGSFPGIMDDPPSLILNLSLLTETCAYLGEGGEPARRLYELLEPYAGRNVVVGPAMAGLGAASRYAGMLASCLGEWDRATQHFDDAMAMNERMGARPWLARTAYDYASMLTSAGRLGVRRDELIAQATTMADDIGMPTLARRASELSR